MRYRQSCEKKMFRKIGQFEITADSDLILVWSSPEFNLESAREYAAAMAVVINRMPPKFGVLARFDTPPILAPEVADDFGMSIASGQWNRIYDPIGVAHAFFSDIESARQWLHGKITAANP